MDRPADDCTQGNSLQPAKHVSKSLREFAILQDCGLPEDGIKGGGNGRRHVSTQPAYASRHQLPHPTTIQKCIIIFREK